MNTAKTSSGIRRFRITKPPKRIFKKPPPTIYKGDETYWDSIRGYIASHNAKLNVIRLYSRFFSEFPRTLTAAVLIHEFSHAVRSRTHPHMTRRYFKSARVAAIEENICDQVAIILTGNPDIVEHQLRKAFYQPSGQHYLYSRRIRYYIQYHALQTASWLRQSGWLESIPELQEFAKPCTT